MRALVTGASGAGSTTLARAFARQVNATFFDSDDYYWADAPAFTHKIPPAQRSAALLADLARCEHSVTAGSVMGWGDTLEHAFDLVVFLYVDTPTRLARLRKRELARYGAIKPGFLEWAAQYDAGTAGGRSLARHRAWLADRRCPVCEFHGARPLDERIAAMRQAWNAHAGTDGASRRQGT